MYLTSKRTCFVPNRRQTVRFSVALPMSLWEICCIYMVAFALVHVDVFVPFVTSVVLAILMVVAAAMALLIMVAFMSIFGL